MAEPKIYPKGIVCFNKHEKQPDFVLGSIVITPNDFIAWLKENEGLMTDYKGRKQIKLQLLKNDKGIYTVVDTYKSAQNQNQQDNFEPPF
ncbi:hypothetical protein [uncultured Flavobacterium sp.]|uniref:hypothetical protein n=1 Tax=uncultured Flavobacterium sp. TaxID=165435 RepID=UPI00259283B4|nr:hypothetical protein [uncultured Flavobacterium sp.]